MVCPKCSKDVEPIKKMWDVLLCPQCHCLIDGGKYSMDKVS